MRILRVTKKYFLAFALILVLSGCSDSIIESTPSIDDEKDPIGVSPTFTDIQKKIFSQSCALSGCHVSGSVSPSLSAISFSNIVNQQSSTRMDYIEPNDPDKSYLLQKLIGSSIISGSRMPLGSSPLSQEKIDTMVDWINNGAKND